MRLLRHTSGPDGGGSSTGPGLFRQPQPARHPHYYKNRA